MTPERARELLPIIQAYAEGKTVQYFVNGRWVNHGDPDFTGQANKYRIKPEPKVIYVNEYPDGKSYGHAAWETKEQAESNAIGANRRVAVKYIEASD